MQDIVIIPTYDRPEMLWLCLEHLASSLDSKSMEYRVYVDAHEGQPPPPRDDIQTVLGKFPDLTLRVLFRSPHTFHGNSFNVMMAYKEAYESTANHVYMVEDDIIVEPEFFIWHRVQQNSMLLDCSIGVGRRPEHAHYASLGVCFRREVIGRLIPHCQTGYFANMRGYCRSKFMPVKWDCEQDGLWCRLLNERRIAWPAIPVAQHVGWYGYHRKKSQRPQGTLTERYQQVRRVLSNPAVLREWQRDFHDVTPMLDWCN